MVLGGLPLLALSVWQQDPALSGHIQDLNINDWGALFYSSLFGSAISYGVFFYNATRGNVRDITLLLALFLFTLLSLNSVF
jgi:drug/metabolite transporter (DMT)-like permease